MSLRHVRWLAPVLVVVLGVLAFAQELCPECSLSEDRCTDIIVGKDASVDGSIILSHTENCDNSNIHVVPAQDWAPDTMAPVYWGLQNLNEPDYTNYGEVIGYIPQVAHTYAYLHDGYPHLNEHQLAFAESTIWQRPELSAHYGICKQIMTIEQAMAFALQRCTTAREAIKLIGALMEKYGFLPSCCGKNARSELLYVGDKTEVWCFEVMSVGDNWDPASGKLGAIWAAQRVPDDHVSVCGNFSVIKEIDLSKPDWFMASANYKQEAIDRGWYDPNGTMPFIWQEVYSPFIMEYNISRLWLFYSTVAPNLKRWPSRAVTDPFKPYDFFHWELEDMGYYPFSVKPEMKLSVQDVIKFERSWYEGTVYDLTTDVDWLVPDGAGNFVKSPLTTPTPTVAMRQLLDINWHRNIAQPGYGGVLQIRPWLPDPIGGVFWFYVGDEITSTYVPIYAGVNEISPLYNNYKMYVYDENSVRWLIAFVDTLVNLRWQDAIKDLEAVRGPFEAGLFASQPTIEAEAVALYNQNPVLAKDYLTKYTKSVMEEVARIYRDLRTTLITKYAHDRQ